MENQPCLANIRALPPSTADKIHKLFLEMDLTGVIRVLAEIEELSNLPVIIIYFTVIIKYTRLKIVKNKQRQKCVLSFFAIIML